MTDLKSFTLYVIIDIVCFFSKSVADFHKWLFTSLRDQLHVIKFLSWSSDEMCNVLDQ